MVSHRKDLERLVVIVQPQADLAQVIRGIAIPMVQVTQMRIRVLHLGRTMGWQRIRQGVPIWCHPKAWCASDEKRMARIRRRLCKGHLARRGRQFWHNFRDLVETVVLRLQVELHDRRKALASAAQ